LSRGPNKGLKIMKNFLLAFALLSLALAVGCAKGGNGEGDGIAVTIDDNGISVAGLNLSIPFTATVTGPNSPSQNVTWSIVGASCTGTPNPCGSLSSTTGTSTIYTAPATVPANAAIKIDAVAQANGTAFDGVPLTITPITTNIAPTPVNVGQGLVQQFTAVALPDNAPQVFTWTCSVNGAACANFVSNTSGVAVYTAQDAACSNGCVQVSAVETTDPTGCTVNAKGCTAAKVSVVPSRINGSYAFHFSGYDSSHNPMALAGSVTVASNTSISGVEDELSSAGYSQNTITGGSYTPSTLADKNTNNAGTLVLNTGTFPNQFQIVLDANGDVRMIESDGHGTGSGVLEKPETTQQFNTAAQTYVFGFTGVDSNGKRAGYVGVLPLDGNGNIKAGMVDSNDGGTASAYTGVTGTYHEAGGIWTMSLTLGAQTLNFDFYISSGQNKNAKSPLTLYAISTDAVDADHPALSGRMVLQDPGTTYDKTALNSYSVSHLTGIDSTGSNTLVSLTLGSGDGNGNFSETFDANNAGTTVQAATAPAPCTYTASTAGRYVVTMLGTGTSSCTGGIPFVLYASGANRGMLLDQSSGAVMTGGMDPQGNVIFAGSALPGTYALGTLSSATSGVAPLVANLLLTSTGNQTFIVGGTEHQYPNPAQAVAGTYSIMGIGTGTITLTTPSANYVMYAIDTTHFEMIDVDKTVTNASVIYAEQ
jgi:hypothetical protein